MRGRLTSLVTLQMSKALVLPERMAGREGSSARIESDRLLARAMAAA
jgi:hypothetical protein